MQNEERRFHLLVRMKMIQKWGMNFHHLAGMKKTVQKCFDLLIVMKQVKSEVNLHQLTNLRQKMVKW